MHTASHNIIIFRTRRSQCLKTGYFTEMTAWHFYQVHMCGTCVSRGGIHSHFFRLTHSAKFEKVDTPLTSQFRGSISSTGQTWRGWISVLAHQRHAIRASLGVQSKQVLPLHYCCIGGQWAWVAPLSHSLLSPEKATLSWDSLRQRNIIVPINGNRKKNRPTAVFFFSWSVV